MKKNNTITILCSGVALGVYVPALILNHKLRQHGIPTDVVVLENLLYAEKKQRINDNKKAFHKSFATALMGQKLARDIRPNLDPEVVNQLFVDWMENDQRRFVIFSGFWLPLVDEYGERVKPQEIYADLIHLDADISASRKIIANKPHPYHEVWLFRHESKQLIHEFSITEKQPLPYPEREERFVIHGGGWGMGTYQDKIPELEKAGLSLDIIAYELAEISDSKPRNRYFMVDPLWCPPFARLAPDITVIPRKNNKKFKRRGSSQ